jgi:hypothetical protein
MLRLYHKLDYFLLLYVCHASSPILIMSSNLITFFCLSLLSPSKKRFCYQSGNTNCGEAGLLIKVVCFVKKVNNILNLKRS